MAEYAVSRDGRPIAVNDYATIMGQVTSISGSGSSATVTVKLNTSGLSISVQAQDMNAAQGPIPTSEIA